MLFYLSVNSKIQFHFNFSLVVLETIFLFHFLDAIHKIDIEVYSSIKITFNFYLGKTFTKTIISESGNWYKYVN